MNTAEILQALTHRNKAAGSNPDVIKSVLDDYQLFLKELRSEKPEELVFRRLEEESRDFGRLITKGHEPILQGRISDGLRALKPLLMPELPTEASESGPVDDAGTSENLAQPESESEQKPFRNLPNLGMD